MKPLFILVIILSPFFSAAQSQRYQMNLPVLSCYAKTEDGEDEVYVLVTWRNSAGATGNIRSPFNHHYDMNNVERADKPNTTVHRYIQKILDFELANGQSIDIFCSLMEEDDGTPSQYEAAGQKILRIANANRGDIFNTITGNSFKSIIANVASMNRLGNSDDWIGSFSYRISKSNGVVTIRAKRIDNSNSNGGQTQTNDSQPRVPANTQLLAVANASVSFGFTGDGSKYNAGVTITTSK